MCMAGAQGLTSSFRSFYHSIVSTAGPPEAAPRTAFDTPVLSLDAMANLMAVRWAV